MPDSRCIEELTLNAWPPLETLLFDGWILSFSDGYTRRANSIHPLYPSTLDLFEKIATCESVYSEHGRETTFKVTDSRADAELDFALEQRGYVGLFDIVVDHNVRNRGIGRRLCTRLLQWARSAGCTTGYLAVLADNAPALKLYANLGFRQAYTYWYRHAAAS